MFVETETLLYLHKSMKLAQWFGVLRIIPKLIDERRIELNRSLLFAIYAWIPRLGNFVGLYVVTSSLLFTTHLKFVKGLLNYSFWIFWIGFMIVVLFNILLDHVYRKHAGLIAYTFRSLFDILDRVDGYSHTCAKAELLADKKLDQKTQIVLAFMYYGATVATPIVFCFIAPILYWNEIIILFEFRFRQVESVLGLSRASDLAIVLFILFIMLPLHIYFTFCLISRMLPIIMMSTLLGIYSRHTVARKINFDTEGAASPELFPRSLHHPKNSMRIYHGVFLASKIISTFTSTLVGFGQVTILLLCVFFIFFAFGKIGTPGEKALSVLSLTFVGIYGTFTIYILGEIYVKSGELLDSWKRKYFGNMKNLTSTDWNIEFRVLMSLQKMKFYVADAYFLDQNSVLVLWQQIIDKTILAFSLQYIIFKASNRLQEAIVQENL